MDHSNIDALQHDSAWKREFRRRLLKWFQVHARDLPWRRTKDPYAIWVSEVMLQQTQVATVIPYYQRFLERFPTVTDLAEADEQQILKLWEGLGYYRRARQLHRAAQEIVERFGGTFPRSLEDTLSLPGIGRYTAGAITSIAYDAPNPILEGNTIRLLSRLSRLRIDPTSRDAQRFLWDFAAWLLTRNGSGAFNQALMELGNLVCRPQSPACGDCPVATLCPTFAERLQSEIPRPKNPPKYEEVHEAAAVVWRGKHVLIRCCQPGERWAGLWDFPRIQVSANRITTPEIESEVVSQTGIKAGEFQEFLSLRHQVTRFRISLTCYRGLALGGRVRKSHVKWVTLQDLRELPLSVTGRKISDRLGESHR